ncbi:beta-ketoacyl-[acyl-carrier-protein] synthase II [Xanthomonas phaseoli pv. syngonii LMG 9055]|uniref:3-oxoacyl-[acyl-carrier-protein] synthase 2 n=1 Tax=Xanthomonas phaseoli pv. syngonii LMG 9055 TaxID=1437878 RepID=A0A1V9GR04_9XANT|nr:beta-ketoacyl-ACP synthase II [Xanthomonas phaseoli]MBO9740171.1 beta-ketoacyl-ACP synthase II [Xanthomonas axonopodis pv. begoniae]OQP73099.1 beta-ketoacyl-[acyl-carrier-protein] synthase II [Xanthomonas phaseoli pv. syngonii LMG 9055]MBO9770248.1 beta-ketoacyl-ACP synthase II [Xanthomonas axonopodis pv. begoniae]MCC8471938.1 beta-ketoacyl-ACP synthase II [Xanthomonas phaseoli]PPT36124.1 beta-ketoacyl-[acyl-carrier-protein] synthase II [Xanthomonas axonopodis pv. begoniae]
MSRRVVVTGMGMVSPLGNDLATSWDGIVHGRSGIGPITQIDASQFTTKIAGEIKNFDPTLFVSAKDVKKMDSFIHYGVGASFMALDDSGLEIDESNAERVGAILGSGIGGLLGIEEQTIKFHEGGARKISPFYVPSTIINMLPGQVSLIKGLKGPTFSAVSACATSNHSIGTAMRMIQHGDADVMLAGGAERGSSPSSVGGFCAMKAMSTRNDDPTGASRPWDKQRDGFVLGDGAGVLVLEEYEHAKARGARIYAELVGFGASSDAFHMTAPSEDGEGAARSMAAALRDAKLNPEQIGYLNAHGTSTPLGDLAETMAMKRALGDHAYKTMVSSTKSMTGHLLGAAGGVEAIFSVMALHTGIIPPTINLEEPSDGCDLDYVPNVAREVQVDAVMSNGFGFGGTNGTLVFKRI